MIIPIYWIFIGLCKIALYPGVVGDCQYFPTLKLWNVPKNQVTHSVHILQLCSLKLLISKNIQIDIMCCSIRVGPNSEYGLNTEYRIICFLKMNEYWTVVFGLNYSNTKYLKSNCSPPPKKKIICEFSDQMILDPLFSYLHEGSLLCFG